MAAYPTREVTFSSMFKLSLKQYVKTFSHALIFILLLFLATAVLPVNCACSNIYIQLAVKCLYSAILFFFFSVALLATHNDFGAVGKSYGAAFKRIFERLPSIACTFIAYMGGIVIVLVVANLLRVSVLHLDALASQTIKGVLMILEIVAIGVFSCMFFFSYPLSVIDEKLIKKSFVGSAYLSEKNKIGIFLLLFMISLPHALLRQHGLDFHFIAQYHLSILYDFLVLSFFVPIFINFLLLLINDSKKQVTDEE